MKKYLHLLFMAFFVALTHAPFETIAQSVPQKTITIGKIKEQMNFEISREKEGEAKGQKSALLDAIAHAAEKNGKTLEAYYTDQLIHRYQAEGYTIIDEQAENEKFASLPESMPSDLNAHFKAKGLKLYRMTRNSYWHLTVNANETATDISNKLGIPVDSLLPLTVTFVRDYYQDKGGLRSTEQNEETKLTRFLTPPYPTYKKATGFDGGALYFPSDRSVKVSSSPQYNDDITFATNLKTYEGNYKYAWDYNVNHNYPGRAKYTYLENLDGSRIYEGKFEFVYDLNKKVGYPYELDVVKINGQFKDNKMVGHWEFYRKSSDNTVTSITMDFDENGKLNGEVEMPKRFKALFSHGRLKYVVWMLEQYGMGGFYGNSYSTMGHFTDFERPKGDWELRMKGEKTLTAKYDNDGYFVRCGYRDNSTGDWHESTSHFPEEIPDRIARFVNDYMMRDTPQYNPIKH